MELRIAKEGSALGWITLLNSAKSRAGSSCKCYWCEVINETCMANAV
jgi:hypothetical protein